MFLHNKLRFHVNPQIAVKYMPRQFASFLAAGIECRNLMCYFTARFKAEPMSSLMHELGEKLSEGRKVLRCALG